MNAPDPVHSRAALERRFGPSYRWRVLATVMIGTVASIMASTIVNVAVPDMAHVFALGQERLGEVGADESGAAGDQCSHQEMTSSGVATIAPPRLGQSPDWQMNSRNCCITGPPLRRR